jgi:hypothetical protein
MIIAAALLCGGARRSPTSFLNQPTELTIAVGPPNSEDTRVVQSIAAQLSREQANVRCKSRSSDGRRRSAAATIDNVRPISRWSAAIRNAQDRSGDRHLRKNVVVFIVPSPAEPAKVATSPAKGKAAAQANRPSKQGGEGKAAKAKARQRQGRRQGQAC